MESEKISVCIATYNGEKYIKQQLLSILSQLPNPYDEVIISDDNSTDNTLRIIKEINDKRITVYESKARNVIYNFENAILHSTGQFIFLADQDDIWSKDKIKTMVPELKNNLLVFSNFIMFSDELNIDKNNQLFELGINQSGFIKNFIKNKFTGATMAFQRDLINYIMPFPKSIPMHDVWIGLTAEYYGKVKYIDTPLIYYRKHQNNLSETGVKSSKRLNEKLMIRIKLFFCLVKRIWRLK